MRNLALRLGLKLSPRDEKDPKSIGGSAGPASGDGLLLETATDFLLLESGDFLLLE